jgi:hypothetical protein
MPEAISYNDHTLNCECHLQRKQLIKTEQKCAKTFTTVSFLHVSQRGARQRAVSCGCARSTEYNGKIISIMRENVSTQTKVEHQYARAFHFLHVNQRGARRRAVSCENEQQFTICE